jgi:hypothetical protein
MPTAALGTAVAGGGAYFATLHNIVSWAGTAGTIVGGVGIGIDVYSGANSVVEGDIPGVVQSGSGIAAGAWALAVPGMWWVPVVGTGGVFVIEYTGDRYVEHIEQEYARRACPEWKRLYWDQVGKAYALTERARWCHGFLGALNLPLEP